jgi:Immunity protein Imm1
MMILTVSIHGQYRHAESWAEMSALISEVMTTLGYEKHDTGGISPGEQACFGFGDTKYSSATTPDWGDNFLYVAYNSESGYGGFTWFVSAERAEISGGGMYDDVWVSDNPESPNFDPRVVSDPGYPLFYHPRSALPGERVREVLEEFCRVGTGERPKSIGWVRGDTNGQRLDVKRA